MTSTISRRHKNGEVSKIVIEHPVKRTAALLTIADYPLSDKTSNVDSENMKMIARRALGLEN